jgi:hypothetical protein
MTAQARNLKTSCASLGLEWKVLSSHELPGGSLVWLHVSPNADDLAAAGAVRELVIAETGVVARLRVKNPCGRDVLLPSDVVVDGGKQARVVERSVIIPAFAEVDIPVRCVEAGRWHPRDAQTAQSFEVSSSVSSGTREHIAQLKQRSLRQRKRYDLDQGEMWNHVTSELDREELTSVTSSYTAVLVKRQHRMDQARAREVKAPQGANGVAVIRPGGACWVEAFPSQGHVDAAVASFVADLLDEPAAPRPPQAVSPHERAASALGTMWGAHVIAVSTPEGTRGDSFAIDAEGVAGCVLLRGAELAHLAVRVALRG